MPKYKQKGLEEALPPGELLAAAILTLDPASKGNAGLCLRSTRTLFTPVRGKLRAPDWVYTGSVWSPPMHDELGLELQKIVKRGEKVLFAATSTAFGPSVALSIGRAIGCIEGLLHDLNVYEDGRVTEIPDATWRTTELPLVRAEAKGLGRTEARELWKRRAVAAVRTLYFMELDDNAAEAALLSDHIVIHRKDLWRKPT